MRLRNRRVGTPAKAGGARGTRAAGDSTAAGAKSTRARTSTRTRRQSTASAAATRRTSTATTRRTSTRGRGRRRAASPAPAPVPESESDAEASASDDGSSSSDDDDVDVAVNLRATTPAGGATPAPAQDSSDSDSDSDSGSDGQGSPVPPTPSSADRRRANSTDSLDSTYSQYSAASHDLDGDHGDDDDHEPVVLASGTGVLADGPGSPLASASGGGARAPKLGAQALHDGRRRFAAHTMRLGEGVFRANLEREEQPRSLVVLALMGGALAAYAFWRDEKADAAENVKQSAASVALVFLIYCVLQTRDGLLVRPHPAVWRVLHGIGVLYLLLLSGIVVLHEDDAKRFLQMLVKQVGTREDGVVQHQGDASDCSISLTTLTRQLTSMWFFAHVVGWWSKMCVFRDVKFCLILAFAFELAEVTLQHVIPEFSECWWDSVFMDTFGANMIGIGLGYLTLKFLDSRHYDWVAYKPKNMRGRLTRVMWQFTPFSWSEYHWNFLADFKTFMGGAFCLSFSLMLEVNAFMLIHSLNIPSEAPVNKLRLLLILLLGVPAVSETYAYLTRPQFNRIGQNAWLVVSIGVVECLVIAKFGRDNNFQWVPPTDVAVCWSIFAALFSLWCALYFCGRRGGSGKRRGRRGERDSSEPRHPAWVNYVLWAAVVALLPLFRRWTWQWPW